jgi:polyhydroxyalkanoic acid synthase PhaR subunit
MNDGTPFPNDPLKLMRDAYAQGIERWSKAMEEIVGSEDFASASGQLLALYAQQQQSIRAASRIAAESIQMPTTEDLAEVAQLVINVERKVDEVTDQGAGHTARLTAIETQLTAVAAQFADATAVAHGIPARLSAIEQKLAEAASASQALSARLAGIEESIRGSAQRPADPPATGRASGATAAQAPEVSEPAAKGTVAKRTTARKPAAPKGAPARRRTPPADD